MQTSCVRPRSGAKNTRPGCSRSRTSRQQMARKQAAGKHLGYGLDILSKSLKFMAERVGLLGPSWASPLRGRRCAPIKIAPSDFVEPLVHARGFEPHPGRVIAE